MEWNKENIEEIVKFINQELLGGRTMTKIEVEEFGVNERVIHKRLSRLGYKKIDNQYRPEIDITCKITPNNDVPENCNITRNITRKLTPTETELDGQKIMNNEIDLNKLNLLLSNLDKILRLIPSDLSQAHTTFRSGINDVSSLRLDTGLYKAIKDRAYRDNVNIADIVNKALEDYLNNYL